ncbi:putative nuclease HARBI1 isoform X2 [Eurosta solidaginis]|uniref:putative nuclease HARBI1 isoform X2 n=1 Tax=Eurosta solidaginis TaxID=178769 RepID=UPI0035311F3A
MRGSGKWSLIITLLIRRKSIHSLCYSSFFFTKTTGLVKSEFDGSITLFLSHSSIWASTIATCENGSGGYQHCVGSDYLVGKFQSTVSKITSHVILEMENKLRPQNIQSHLNETSECKQWFMDKYKIPGVIGCIDGTHIGLQRPSVDEHMYFNRKGYHSINAFIMCDHTYKILAINCQYGGAAHDSFVWRHSDQRRVLQERFEINRRSNAWLLGDSGYPLEPWHITPYRIPADGSSE